MAKFQHATAGAAAARIVWLLAGPMALVLIGFGILQAGSGWVTVLDGLFFLVLAAILAARRYEFSTGEARTSTGERVTGAHLRRYGLLVVAVGSAAWIALNALGNHLLPGWE